MQPSILLADDDQGTLELYGKFFERAGWSFDLVPDGKSAITAARSRSYDVILTDLVMPGMDGFELLRMLKAISPDQPVIVVSGRASIEDVVQSLREGATDILIKPIDFNALHAAVERILPSLQSGEGLDKTLYRFLQSAHSTFEIPAEVLARHKFQVGIIDRLAKAGIIERNMQLRMQLAVQEAIANSVEHGALELDSAWKEEYDSQGNDKFSRMREERLQDPKYGERKIRIHVSFEHFRLRISIRDPGRGFLLRDKAPEETKATSAIRSYGRGLAIIAGTMDELRFQHAGAEVIMVKYLI